MRRREFIAVVGGVTVTWPLSGRTQQSEQPRRIGLIMSAFGPDDPEGRARIAANREVLERLGWTDGGNVRIEVRWVLPANDANLMRAYARELVALSPDVIMAQGSTAPWSPG